MRRPVMSSFRASALRWRAASRKQTLPNPWRFRCGSFRVGSKQARHIGLLRARRLQSAQTKIIANHGRLGPRVNVADLPHARRETCSRDVIGTLAGGLSSWLEMSFVSSTTFHTPWAEWPPSKTMISPNGQHSKPPVDRSGGRRAAKSACRSRSRRLRR
jgi:hypothetical protein